MQASTLAEKLSSAILNQPQGMAFDFKGKSYNWDYVNHFVDALERRLDALGIVSGERVGLIAHTRPHHVACLWGLLIHGRVASMIYGYQSAIKMASDIRQMRYPLIIADAHDWNPVTIAAAREAGSAALSISAEGVRWVEDLTGVGLTTDRSRLPEVAVETLSSGTTGTPKRIPLSLANLQSSAEAAVSSIRNMQGEGASSPMIIALPLGNISGVYAVLPPALMGQSLALLEKFDVDAWLTLMARYQPATADIPPAAMAMLYKRGIDRKSLNSVRVIRTGAAPLDAKVHAYFSDTLGIPVNLSYGASEFCGVVTTWMLDELHTFGASKRGSCGRALPGINLRVVDRDTGVVLQNNESGLLEVLTARVGPNWIRTSDLVHIDDDGFMWFEGRNDNTIFRGGFKVAPEAVAEILRQHPHIEDAGVVGVGDDRLGQVPVAALQLSKDGSKPSDKALKDFCREHLAAHQIPVEFIWLKKLPRTTSLKLSTADLKAQLTGLLEESI